MRATLTQTTGLMKNVTQSSWRYAGTAGDGSPTALASKLVGGAASSPWTKPHTQKTEDTKDDSTRTH